MEGSGPKKPAARSGEAQAIRALAPVLSGRARRVLTLPGFHQSAVLLPVVLAEGADAQVLFTVRRPDLKSHPGQIAFPGGKRDPRDASLAETALRETREELGLSDGISLIGPLDDIPTPSGFVITPFLAAIDGPLALCPNRGEVEEVFTAPIRELARGYVRGPEREFHGQRYVMHEFLYGRFRIWGATASMLRQLFHLLGLSAAE